MPDNVTYIARDLADLADFIELQGDTAMANSHRCVRKRLARECEAVARGLYTAANIIRAAKLES